MPFIQVEQKDLETIQDKTSSVQQILERILGKKHAEPQPTPINLNIVQPIPAPRLPFRMKKFPPRPFAPRRPRPPVSGLFVGMVNSLHEKMLASLDEPDWNKVGGKYPQIPGWNWHVPPICTRSMATSLQRIFFSGVNILRYVKQLIDAGKLDNAKTYMRQIQKMWDQHFFAKLFQRYGQNQENNNEIKTTQNLLKYVFTQLEPKEFLDKFGKMVYHSYFNYKP